MQRTAGKKVFLPYDIGNKTRKERMSKYFFRPRIGKYYQDGYQGLKTLVLGAYPYCWHQSCPHWQQCVAEERPYDYETLCPSYAEKADRAYYRLSNSNTIEIDAYIEGEHYPAYDAFTHRMLGKKTPLGPQYRAFFWDRVAFYNWIQHYLPGPQEAFGYDVWEKALEKDAAAWNELLNELQPDIVYVWTDAVRRFLDHCYGPASSQGTLVCLGQVEMESLEVWCYGVIGKDGLLKTPSALSSVYVEPRKNSVQFRTFCNVVRSSALYPRLGTETAVAEVARILKKAYGRKLIDLMKRDNGHRRIVCVDNMREIVLLIDEIRRKVTIEGCKRGLKIEEIQRLLNTDIKNIPQKLQQWR